MILVNTKITIFEMKIESLGKKSLSVQVKVGSGKSRLREIGNFNNNII